MNEGDRVRICDGSEAHGDTGGIWTIQDNGIYLVELDDGGCLWPVERHEIVREDAEE